MLATSLPKKRLYFLIKGYIQEINNSFDYAYNIRRKFEDECFKYLYINYVVKLKHFNGKINYSFHVILLGNGKTQFINKLSRQMNNYQYINNEMIILKYKINREYIRVGLLNDISYRYVKYFKYIQNNMNKSILKAKMILLINDLTDDKYLESLNMFNAFIHNCVSNKPTLLIGIHSTKRKQRYRQMKKYGKEHNMEYYECNSKTGKGINTIMKRCIQILYHRYVFNNDPFLSTTNNGELNGFYRGC